MTERPASKRPRRPPARRARLAVAALGVAAVFSLAAAMGITDERARQQDLSAASPPPIAATSQAIASWSVAAPDAPPPIRLKPRKVVRVVGAGTATAATGTGAAPTASAGVPTARAAAPPPASAPVAKTNGSR